MPCDNNDLDFENEMRISLAIKNHSIQGPV